LLPQNVNFDFVGKRKFFLILSSVLNLLAILLFFVRGVNFGIDFVGGTDVRVRFAQATSAHDLRQDLGALDLPDLTVQEFGSQGKEFMLRFEPETATAMNTVSETIKGALAAKHQGEGAFEILSVESVGPKVGADLRKRGFLAVACTTLFMGIYIAFRFELSFGIGAVIALIHDVLIALLALILSQTIFDLTTLAAMMTVIGFSVHDTIIVSDRVRENLRKMRRSSLAEVINVSINETLSRTILTTGTALLVLLALYFLGGPGLQPFAFTLIVGFLTGTYSSIFIAAPVVLFWSNRSKLAGAE
jgi:preprotein translocase subunit SecF